jgi:midasin (ATPase involved in ribosome maturation)
MCLFVFQVVCQAMQRLEIGSVGLMSFGSTASMVLPFGTPFTDDNAQTVRNVLNPRLQTNGNKLFIYLFILVCIAQAVSKFTFASKSTKLTEAVTFASTQLEQIKSHGQYNADQYQLVFMICDGGHSETADKLLPIAHKALSEQKLICFIILDNEGESSVMNRKVCRACVNEFLIIFSSQTSFSLIVVDGYTDGFFHFRSLWIIPKGCASSLI